MEYVSFSNIKRSRLLIYLLMNLSNNSNIARKDIFLPALDLIVQTRGLLVLKIFFCKFFFYAIESQIQLDT